MKYLKFILKSVLALIILILIYGLFAFSLAKITINDTPKSGNIPIYILSNGVHTDIVMPIKTNLYDWSKTFPYTNTISKDTLQKYIAIGWGNKGFYLNTPTWADLKFSTAFNAAFGMSSSALHTTFYKQITEDEQCKKIMINEQDYLKLIQYINHSIQLDSIGNAQVIHTNAQYGNSDAFYEANGKYNLFQTCNTWSNDALKNCQQKAALWTITDTGILQHYP